MLDEFMEVSRLTKFSLGRIFEEASLYKYGNKTHSMEAFRKFSLGNIEPWVIDWCNMIIGLHQHDRGG